ncbi:MAG: MMPL family transporter [Myxococcales bacterium]|nr:MMPL family transporter [Myxococcales bacterium]
MLRAALQGILRHPWRILAATAVVAIVAGALMSRVGFDANYSALLPRDSPTVRAFEAVRDQLGGGTTDLVVELRGPAPARAAVGRALAAALADDPRFAWVDLGVDDAFFLERSLYLIPLADLAALVAAAQAATAAAPTGLDGWATVRTLGDAIAARALAERARFRPSADDALFVLIRPRIPAAQLAQLRECVAAVTAALARIDPRARGVDVRYSGRLAIHLAEQRATKEDLSRATTIALVLVVLITALVFRRLAGPLVIAVPLVLSLVLTLVASTFLVAKLNLLSAFMIPALVGLGIDFGIHLYYRFLVELRGGRTRVDAMDVAVRATIGASAASAVTTAGAFFALTVVDFRGFRELGLLGGTGVLVTFVTTYVVVPALAPIVTRGGAGAGGAAVDDPDQRRDHAAAGPSRAARAVAAAVVGVALAAGVWSLAQVPRVAFENDFAKLKGTAAEIERTERLEAERGLILSPAVIMVDDLASARRVEQAAEALQREAGEPTTGLEVEPVAIRAALSVARFMPDQLPERAALLTELRATLARAQGAGPLTDGQRRTIDLLARLGQARPWTLDELPPSLRRRLIAVDGARLFVFVWPNNRLYRDRVMRAWQGVLDRLLARAAAAPGGAAGAIQLLDERRLPLEVADLVRRDLPTAFALASLLVLLTLVVHFRRATTVLLVAATMVLAIALTLAALVVTGIQLNGYNAVLLPCIVGIGIDNGIHIQHAYGRAGPGSMRSVFATTGVAALLASATTLVGFGTSIIARQGGLRAMGLTAVIGVTATFVASTIVLPATLILLEGRRPPPTRLP